MDTAVARAEHEEFVKRMEEAHKRQDRRLELLEENVQKQNALLSSIEKLAVNMESMQKELTRQGERLETLENRDGEMWRKVTGYIITTVVGAVIGFVLTKLGLR